MGTLFSPHRAPGTAQQLGPHGPAVVRPNHGGARGPRTRNGSKNTWAHHRRLCWNWSLSSGPTVPCRADGHKLLDTWTFYFLLTGRAGGHGCPLPFTGKAVPPPSYRVTTSHVGCHAGTIQQGPGLCKRQIHHLLETRGWASLLPAFASHFLVVGISPDIFPGETPLCCRLAWVSADSHPSPQLLPPYFNQSHTTAALEGRELAGGQHLLLQVQQLRTRQVCLLQAAL